MLDNGSDSNVLFTGKQFLIDNNRSSIGTYRCIAFNGIGAVLNRTIDVDVACKLFIMYRSAVRVILKILCTGGAMGIAHNSTIVVDVNFNLRSYQLVHVRTRMYVECRVASGF